MESAGNLRVSEKLDASALKKEQYQAAMKLKEGQTIKALRKRKSDKN
jgi:hypothetical protein